MNNFDTKTKLHNLWKTFPSYRYINNAQYVRKRELEITKENDYIEQCRNEFKLNKVKKRP